MIDNDQYEKLNRNFKRLVKELRELTRTANELAVAGKLTLSKTKELLQTYHEDAVQSFNMTKGVKGIKPVRNEIYKIVEVLTVLQEQAEEKTLTKNGLIQYLRGVLTERTDSLNVLIDEHLSLDQSPDQKLSNHFQDAYKMMGNFKKKFEKKIPKRLRIPSSFQLVKLPLLAQMNAELNNEKLLKSLGIPHSTFNYERGMGIVWEDQYCLMFDREIAQEQARIALEEEDEQRTEGKKAVSQRMRKNTAERKKVLTEIANITNNTSKRQIESFINEVLDKKEEEAFDFQGYFQRRIRNKALREELQPDFDDMILRLKKIENEREGLEGKRKLNNSRSRKKNKEIDNNLTLVRTANQALAHISKQTGQKFSVLTQDFMVNPKNSKIVMFWIVPEKIYKDLLVFGGSRIDVRHWGLPWSMGSEYKKIATPKSIHLTVKNR